MIEHLVKLACVYVLSSKWQTVAVTYLRNWQQLLQSGLHSTRCWYVLLIVMHFASKCAATLYRGRRI